MNNKNYIYLLAPLLLLTSCSLWQFFTKAEEETPLRFPHQVHVTGEEMSCTDCHKVTRSGDEVGMPKLEDCLDCHDMEEEKEKLSKSYALISRLKEEKSEYPWQLEHLDSDVIFSHKSHIVEKVACMECHNDIETDQGVIPIQLPTMDSCVSCHQSYKTALNCQDCHKDTRKDTPPKSHKLNWRRSHGDETFLSDATVQNRCAICHEKDGCNKCHQAEKPFDHNNFWRRSGHGLAAEMDRDRCALCHKEDSCTRCHEETKPRNHRGTWGSSRNTHCLNCHEPSTGNNCSVCHRNTVGHAAYVTAMPNNTTHNSATECRVCHGDLKHFDNGQNCRVCHR